MGKRFEKYNLWWEESKHPLSLEMDMITEGGRFKTPKGKIVGEGLAFHFKEAIGMIWPEIKFHDWNNLIIENYLTHRTIVMIGPASSGKTHTAAICLLMDYYCYPTQTTGIVCSTTRDRLEDRIWGEVKKHHKLATSRYRWLPGHLIEGKQRIVTDDRNEATEGRDFRNGIVGVPCLLFDSEVDTPSGTKRIQDVRVDDVVINANGNGVVTEVHHRYAPWAVRITLKDGRSIECTPEHPIFTERGWIQAIDLTTSDVVFSGDETVRVLRQTTSPRIPKQKVLQRSLSRFQTSKELYSVWESFPSLEPEGFLVGEINRSVLFSEMRQSLACRKSAKVFNQSEVRSLWETVQRDSLQPPFLFPTMPTAYDRDALCGVQTILSIGSGITGQASDEVLRIVLQEECNRSSSWNQTEHNNETRIYGRFGVSSCEAASSGDDRAWSRERDRRTLLRDGHRFSGFEIGNRDRWGHTQFENQERCEEDRYPSRTRVESIAILKQGSDPRFDESRGGYPVYNLEVSGHPSYSVNGVVVHNCKKGGDYVGLGDFIGIKNKRVILVGDELHLLPRVFVDAISNLDKNPYLVVMGLGNPKETTDALGVLGEPAAHLGGWESGIDQLPKTKTWDTRRPQGVCIQLVGTDSPNLNGKLGIPLITQEQIDRDVAFYGRDSLWFTMMNQGVMPRGQGSRRVITRQMCQKFGAMNPPHWSGTPLTKIAFLDAAYRGVGGDRCVFGELDFGEETTLADNPGAEMAQALINVNKPDVEKRKIIALIDQLIVPIKPGVTSELPEDQIVAFVQTQCEARGIPPRNFFFDSGMRTSLVSAFARIWSPDVQPIDCGGKPSDRKVSHDIDVLCSDYYQKFITELWYSVRLAIEAGQFRGMTEEVMMEGCAREWKMVGANKIEVETKEEMKLKTGRSPDLFDALAVGVEGARRLGFVIRKLANDHRQRLNDRWKTDLKNRANQLFGSKTLNYAA